MFFFFWFLVFFSDSDIYTELCTFTVADQWFRLYIQFFFLPHLSEMDAERNSIRAPNTQTHTNPHRSDNARRMNGTVNPMKIRSRDNEIIENENN